MSTSAQRRAWNEAMKSAGAVTPSSKAHSTSGSALTASSDRRRKASRREMARKSTLYGTSSEHDLTSATALEERNYRVAVHMDMLEGVTDNTTGIDDDDDYNEFEDIDDDAGESKGGHGKNKRRRISGGSSSLTPKYLRHRSLASILIEEASRSDSVAKQYVDAAVSRFGLQDDDVQDVPSSATVRRNLTKSYPSRKFCPVTGLLGQYTDPKSGIPYATLPALEQIRERAPPWLNPANGGSASYWEAVKALKHG